MENGLKQQMGILNEEGRLRDFEYKVKAIRALLDKKGVHGVEIKNQANFSYITRGRGFIGLASTVACGSLFITKDRVVLLGENIDARRLFEEQLPPHPMVELMAFSWDEPDQKTSMIQSITNGLVMISESELEPELFTIRTILSEYDQADFKVLCHEAAVTLETLCKQVKPGMTEYELAGEISKAFWSQNIEPITTLVAFDERALKYRHPVMTDKRLKNYALAGICGRRNGLIVSITRDVLIEPDPIMQEKHAKCVRVNGAFWEALKPGKSVSEVFGAGVNQYGLEGYPLEHKEHHQGGLTGFIPRELRASYESTHKVRVGEAYAFNPTIIGSKVEDTVLVTEWGLENLTHTGNYAYEKCLINGLEMEMPTVWVIKQS